MEEKTAEIETTVGTRTYNYRTLFSGSLASKSPPKPPETPTPVDEHPIPCTHNLASQTDLGDILH